MPATGPVQHFRDVWTVVECHLGSESLLRNDALNSVTFRLQNVQHLERIVTERLPDRCP